MGFRSPHQPRLFHMSLLHDAFGPNQLWGVVRRQLTELALERITWLPYQH